jgi:hypothetical protein
VARVPGERRLEKGNFMAASAYETAEVKRLTALAEIIRASIQQGGGRRMLRMENEERAYDADARLRAHEERRQRAASQRAEALRAAKNASAHANSTALRCLFSSFVMTCVAVAVNALNPCPLFINGTLGLMAFVLVSWVIVAADHTMRIADLSRR